MIKYILFLIFCLSSVFGYAENIRVRLASKQKSVILTGQNLSVNGVDNPLSFVSVSKSNFIKIQRAKINQQDVWQVEIGQAGARKTQIYAQRFLLIKGENIYREGYSYPSQLFLSPQPSSQFDLIAQMPLENYIVGVLASEMPLSWPMDALKAQAVAARSYVLATMRNRKNALYHVESSILDQVFTHVSTKLDSDPLIKKAIMASKETAGKILIGNKGAVFKSFYHSDCGGSTLSAKSAWGVDDLNKSVKDPWCPSNPKAKWSLALEKDELMRRLGKTISKGLSPLNLFDIERDKDSLKVMSIKLALSNGEVKKLTGEELRQAIGYSDLRSTQFLVSQSDTKYVFSGTGFGHGVGLCQWGSKSMAQNGYSYLQILKHYYPKAQLNKSLEL